MFNNLNFQKDISFIVINPDIWMNTEKHMTNTTGISEIDSGNLIKTI